MTILPVVSAVAAIVLYANSLGNGFAFDDYYMVQTNEAVHSFDDLPGLPWQFVFHWGERLLETP